MIVSLLRRLDEGFIGVSATGGGRLLLTPLLPDTHPLDPALLDECRRRKPELLAYLRWSEKADWLLLEASNRLSLAWEEEPRTVSVHEFWGVIIAGDAEWLGAEKAIRDAYVSQDKTSFLSAIGDRDRLAMARMAQVKQVTA